MSVEIDGVNKIIKTDTISEATSANDLTLDVAGDIILDAGGSDISLKGNGAEYGKFNLTGNSLNIHSSISDGDILFKGSDGGTAITALYLDMSDSGMAHFNNYIKVANRVVGSNDLILTSSDANEKIHMDDAGFIKIETDGTEVMRIASDGDIGLGTSDPTQNLELVVSKTASIPTDGSIGSTNNGAACGMGIHNENNSAVYSGLNFETRTTHASRWLIGNEWKSSYNGDLFFRARDGASSSSEILRLKSDGRVGIGNTAMSSLNSEANNLVVGTGSGSEGITIYTGSSAGHYGSIFFADGTDSNAEKRGQIRYEHNNEIMSFYTNVTERMRIDSSGLIGIGNTTASSFNSGANKLVVGTGSGNNGLTIFAENNASSSIYFADGTSGDAAYRGYIQFNHSSDAMVIATSATQVASFHTDGIVFNENSNDQNFRVESDAATNAFFIDGGTGCAGFQTSSSTAQLFIENQNSSGGRAGLIITNPSSSAAMNGQEITCTKSGSSAYSFLLFRSNASSPDTEFNFRGDGNAFCDGSFAGGGADYAEYFEWKDGNASDEDRVGYSVVLDNNKIVKATDSDDDSKIIGVISGNPAVVGDGDIERWKSKYLKDDYGRYVWEEYTSTEWVEIEEDGNNKNHSYETDKIPSDVTVPSDATVVTTEKDDVTKLTRRKINPSYDNTKEYVSRENRKEWDTVGLMGKLRLRKGQPTGTNWIKMRDISDTVEEWLVR